MDIPRLLLLSGSKYKETPYFEHAQPEIADFLGRTDATIGFIPFANPKGMGLAEYTDFFRSFFEPRGYKVISFHNNPEEALRADVMFGGGGNTFKLLYELQQRSLLKRIEGAIMNGTPYIGASAGSNLACPDIRMTNDKPIVWPHTPNALAVLPFNIDPHFPYSDVPPAPNQETRKERVIEFLIENQDCRVLALREGAILRREGDSLMLKGHAEALLFTHTSDIRKETYQPIVYVPGTDLSHLL